jgi:predicted nucleic acid-binding protein
MKKTVYVETTVFSFYHDERPDCAWRRQVTRAWWRSQKRRYELGTSAFAIEEASQPVYPGWQKVAALSRTVPVFEVVEEVAGIIAVYMEQQIMPADDAGDAAHLAVASYHGVDYLLTWNCRHLANANKFEHIRVVNRRLGLMTPELVTPEQLFEETQS